MKYLVSQNFATDWFVEEFDNLKEAIEYAESKWLMLTPSEKKRLTGFYILESVNPGQLPIT